MDTAIMCSSVTAPSTSAVNHLPLISTIGTYNSSSTNTGSIMPCSGTIKNLRVIIDVAPGVGKSRVFTVQKNGVDTAVTLTIADNATSATDLTHNFNFVASDKLTLATTPSGTPAAVASTTFNAIASCATNTSFLAASASGNTSASATNFMGLMHTGSVQATANVVQCVIPTSGTLRNFYAGLSASPGAGTSYTFTLYKNGSPTSITATISDTNTTASDLAHSVTVDAGDLMYWQIVPSTTPNARIPRLSLEFDPSLNGESVQTFGNAANTSNVTTQYGGLAGNGSVSSTDATHRFTTPAGVTIKKLTVRVSAAPGASKTNTFDFMKNGSAAGPSVAITGAAATTGSDTTSTTTTNADDSVDVRITPANTPAAGTPSWGLVAYIQGTDTSPRPGAFFAAIG